MDFDLTEEQGLLQDSVDETARGLATRFEQRKAMRAQPERLRRATLATLAGPGLARRCRSPKATAASAAVRSR